MSSVLNIEVRSDANYDKLRRRKNARKQQFIWNELNTLVLG